jgi:hypothetical protein
VVSPSGGGRRSHSDQLGALNSNAAEIRYRTILPF